MNKIFINFSFEIVFLYNIFKIKKAEYEDKLFKSMLKDEHFTFLQQQEAEQKKSRDEWKKQKFGSINAGFYDGFGKSCR
jgi:hypothetical protein